MGKKVIINILRLIILVLLQAGLFKNIGYYNIASPYPYVLFLLLLPIGISNFTLYLIAFSYGLIIDAFYDSIGLHAAACICLMAFRIFFHNITLDVEFKKSYITPSIAQLGFKWFISYIAIGTFIHHLALFLIEAFSFKNILYTLMGSLISSVFSILVILLITLLTYRKKSYVNG